VVDVVGALAALLLAASPVQGSVFGPVVSVKGSTFTITTSLSPSGRSAVSAGSAKITEQAAAPRSSLKAGTCIMATGKRDSKGVVAATRITISTPVKGSCTTQLSIRGGTRPAGAPPPVGTRVAPKGGFTPNANFGFALGSVTKVHGSTLTVKGPRATTTVTVSAKTSLMHTVTVQPSAITTSMCAFVAGTSTNKGVTVKATSISLSEKQNGACAVTRFGGPGR
jgi:Domain of unknown function (DUF5666)